MLLPTMGGQTALNCALSLNRMGVLEKFDVEMIGAKAHAIDMAEDRQLFREAMARIGLYNAARRIRQHARCRSASPRRMPSRDDAASTGSGLIEEYHLSATHAGAGGDDSIAGLPAVVRPRSRSAAPAAASPTRSRSSTSWCSPGSKPRPPTKC